MAFWGIEVKPGKPYTHLYDNSRGRLRISQATLAIGKSTNKSTVQCNVGNKSPILLCNLIPNVLETCHLELEFEEAEEVIFSVLGQRSVHLSGYYIGSSGRNLGGDDTDSYGEDIADSDTSGSCSSYGGEDDYESDFIDDADIEMFPTRHKSGVVIEEIEEDEKPSNGNANRRRLKKKHELSDSDDGGDDSQGQLVVKRNSSAVLESEDEDGFPISFSVRRKNAPNKTSEGNLNSKSGDKTANEDKKRKIDSVFQDGGSMRETCQPSVTLQPSEIGSENNEKSKKKKRKAKDENTLQTGSEAFVEEKLSVKPNQNQDDNKENGIQLGEANADSIKAETDGTDNDGKAKKKKKEKGKKGKTSGSGSNVSVEKAEDVVKEDTSEVVIDHKMDQDPPVGSELEKLPPNHNEAVDPSVPSGTTTQETSRKQKKKKNKKKAEDDEGHRAEGGIVVDVNQTDAKKKKKKSKNNDKDLVPNQEPEAQGKSEETKTGLKTRTYPNGLVVEELAMGKPDGKKATPGNKVSLNYIGKLKNGTIFDSTVGRRPFTFRLGIGQVIKGWDVGVKGMRVGDKRKLTIPPDYGYGQKSMGPIPANSWLIFDVELVSVQ